MFAKIKSIFFRKSSVDADTFNPYSMGLLKGFEDYYGSK